MDIVLAVATWADVAVEAIKAIGWIAVLWIILR
jgi:hypothetical protein